jgi:IPT/TIG domain
MYSFCDLIKFIAFLLLGEMKSGCGPSDMIDDQQREDKLVIVRQGRYYGHPNPRRAAYFQDSRQCVWRNPTEATSADYEAPIAMQLSSAAGIIEYTADYFNGQLRGNLLHVKYKSTIRRTVLSPDGLSVNSLSKPAISLVGSAGLDVAQAPNGNLVEMRYSGSTIFVQKPTEAATTIVKVYTVFPNRGGLAGGTVLKIYGANFGTNPTVTVGTNACPKVVGKFTSTYIECTLPGGSGSVDVIVSSGSGSYTFERGYRYIVGA